MARSGSGMAGRRNLVLLVVSLVCAMIISGTEGLVVGFYARTCPRAELIVRTIIQSKFRADRTITPALLRLHFHDCFVNGCDGSILITSTAGNTAEKDAGANLTVRGFDLIDTIKAALEQACPGRVSCADIIALATRDSVVLAGGVGYQVPTGRRDGRISRLTDVNLPGPTMSVAQASAAFAAKGMSRSDLVTLLGAHTVGITHCAFMADRLWNFKGTGRADPAMDPRLVTKLKRSCPQVGNGLGNAVNLDQGTVTIVDRSFFSQIVARRGILQLDQSLATDRSTSGQARLFASARSPFTVQFAGALVRLGNVGVKQGLQGEIRRVCSRIN